MKNTNTTTTKDFSKETERQELYKAIQKAIKIDYSTKDKTFEEFEILMKMSAKVIAELEFLKKQIIDCISYISDENEKRVALDRKKDVQDKLKDINAFIKFVNQKNEMLNSLERQALLSFKKLKSFEGWDTPLKQLGKQIFLIEGFSKNCKVFIHSDVKGLKIECLPLYLRKKSEEQQKHFNILCKENTDTVTKAVRKWLNTVDSHQDLLNIIQVQKELERMENEKKNAKELAQMQELKNSYYNKKENK